MMRYPKILLVTTSTLILAFWGCNSSPTASNSDLLYAKTSKSTYSSYDTIVLNIYNNTEDSVYFKYYDNVFIALSERKSNDKWIAVDFIPIQSGAILNARILMPDSLKQYKKYATYTGKFRFRIPYNNDGSLNFPDTLISNTFKVEQK